jgi:agmatine deiminase
MIESPRDAGFRQPGEWLPHRACWLAWPSEPELWPDLARAQASHTLLCKAIAQPERHRRGERLELLVRDADAQAEAELALAGLDVRFHQAAFGDIWMRDIAPLFLRNRAGEVASVRFRFNGWGGKYVYAGDELIAERVQELSALPRFASELVFEGGAVESDGEGLCLTTREVALHENRNPGHSERDVEAALEQALGAERVIWIERGLANDHTDGHIDNVARFIGPGRALCARAIDRDDPNAEVLVEIARALEQAGLEVATLPSPGLVTGRDGRALPASYLNFYLANESVVVPTFGSRHDELALGELETLFPARKVVGVPSKVFLEEGGTVHCITQQEPLGSHAAAGGGE